MAIPATPETLRCVRPVAGAPIRPVGVSFRVECKRARARGQTLAPPGFGARCIHVALLAVIWQKPELKGKEDQDRSACQRDPGHRLEKPAKPPGWRSRGDPAKICANSVFCQTLAHKCVDLPAEVGVDFFV